jgi:hypothetical protein
MSKLKREPSIYTGVFPYNKYKWSSCIVFQRFNRRYLGIYDTEEEASIAYQKAYNELDDERKSKVSNIKKKNYE